MKSEKKIMVAMSGGVDSSVAAALLLEQGWEVGGVYMELGFGDGGARAGRVAAFLGVPLRVVDLRADFQRQVLDYFVRSYASGRTPNPCVVCNPQVKFGRLLEFARSRGVERLATGHYALLRKGKDGRIRLCRGADPKKDQSYFLCRLRPDQLPGLVFPHGERTKDETYRLAARLGLAGRHGSESQDVCFMQGTTLREFLGRHGPSPQPGDIVTAAGEVKGRHRGISHYTVGQRRGLGVPDATPYYVTALDPERNRVVIGKEEDLWRDEMFVAGCVWQGEEPPALPARMRVQIRYRHRPAWAEVSEAPEGRLRVVFEEKQRAVTPGQFAAFYDGTMVLGGAEIV